MGLAEAEFWRTTPLQFDSLLEQYMEEQRQQDARAGIIASLIANSIPTKKKRKPAKPEDFFPSLKRRRKSEDEEEGAM